MVILALAEQQANQGGVLLFLQNAIHRREVEVELSGVFRLELTIFQLNHHIAAKIQIIKQQVNLEVIAAHIEVVLIAEKRRANFAIYFRFLT